MRIRRSPHGERGLKCLLKEKVKEILMSLPPRGAWIEIRCHWCGNPFSKGRSPHGERGLKFGVAAAAINEKVVAPPTGSVD